MLNADHLREEIICLRREYRKKLKLLSPDIDISYTIPFNDMYVDHPQLNLLLSWCQAVCKLYGIEVTIILVKLNDYTHIIQYSTLRTKRYLRSLF